MLTYEQQEANRQGQLNEVGTEPPCSFCRKPRVKRSDYIRCGLCGVNWLDGEMHLPGYLDRDPRVVRSEAARTVSETRPTAGMSGAGAE